MIRAAVVAQLGLAAVACSGAPPAADPVAQVTVAPRSTSAPSDPVLLVGPKEPPEPRGGFERVRVAAERLESDFRPPQDRCPEGIGQLYAVHLPLGEAMELPAGGTPVSAMGAHPDAVDVSFDSSRKVVRVTAAKYGVVYVVVERAAKCTLYGVNAGY